MTTEDIVPGGPLRIVLRAASVPDYGRWQDHHHLSHDSPLDNFAYASVGTDDPLPNGTYGLSGQQDEAGRWIYVHQDDGATD